MTLEKLLVFGLALAVFTGIAVLARGTGETRDVQEDGYVDKIGVLVDKAK